MECPQSLAQYLPVAMTRVTLINIRWVHMVPLFLKSCATLMRYTPVTRLTEEQYAANNHTVEIQPSPRQIIWSFL